ncbi:MAG: xanthine dehydrogenase family protein molybdopterin-binding subunit [Mesorhizobium sp.]|uniref:xanthine dehydrogenase family protein molybdopterin-binding subunit n=1 Tax=Mesorhizobium sp. TaxID=1871066 RepID=UPI000FE9BFDF|nr:xanthine dehydrogenase family protein molybdopterin-binding subunit [Mesorhizobium sp.]RWI50290.1 MAG: xanthine dehydrogenase family protein molybdopterin-binding subunit [Mesorhizobium sp.]
MNEAVQVSNANMGQPVPRYDGWLKVTGAARYTSDTPVTDAAYAYLVTSAVARGRITAFDETATRAVPGVLDVMTHRNRPPLNPIKMFIEGGQGLMSAPALESADIHHEGEIVAMVLADSYEAAREGGQRLVVRYDRAEPAATFDSPGADEQLLSDVVPAKADPRLGDAEAALADAAVVIDARYETPPQHHNAIELFSTTARWDDDELTVFEPSQIVYGLKEGLAIQLGIAPERIRAVSHFVGGGFGAKAAVTQRTALVALAARTLRRPVKLVLTRDQGFTLSGNRQESRHHVRIGASRDGRITAYHHDIWEVTARTDAWFNAGIDHSAAMYRFPAVASTARLVRVDRQVPMAMRAPSEVQSMFALESAMDEMAVALGMDPMAFRLLNETDRNMVTGKPFTSRSLVSCYEQASAAFAWPDRDPRPRSMRDGEWLIGWGCATAMYPTLTVNCVVRVRYDVDGSVIVQFAGHDLGTGAYTVFQQEAALRLGVPLARIKVEMGDTRLPPGPLAGGSTGSATGCSAIAIACAAILKRLGLTADADDEARTAAFARLAVGSVEEQGDYAPAGSATGSTASAYRGSPDFTGGVHGAKTMFAFGAQFVEVRIHARTHEIRVPRVVGAYAAGRILNPRTARSQLMGGLIWGISSALHEATEIDRREARYVNDNLAEYLIPVCADIRDIKVMLVPEVDTECNPAGVKGVGELGCVGTAAAIANAVFHATGKRIRDLPITIDKLLQRPSDI